MPVDLSACSLALKAGRGSIGCDWCGRLLTGQRSRWCSNECVAAYRANHVWTAARAVRVRRDDGRCVKCGSGDRVEVNHRVPLAGRTRRESCAHHQDNLETLCHDCHVEATRAQRRDGWFGGG